MEILVVEWKKRPIVVFKTIVALLDKAKCSQKFLDNNLSDSTYVYVKCDIFGQPELKGKKQLYSLFNPVDCPMKSFKRTDEFVKTIQPPKSDKVTQSAALETVSGNQIIADFMGYVYDGSNVTNDRQNKQHHRRLVVKPDGTPITHGTLKHTIWAIWAPHVDWNDLMEVAEKIEKIGETESRYGTLVNITTTNVTIYHSFDKSIEKVSVTIDLKKAENKKLSKIEAVWKAVVLFLTEYAAYNK